MAAVSRTPSLADYWICLGCDDSGHNDCAEPRRDGHVCGDAVRLGDLGKWLTERRNVVEDYAKIYGEFPDNPGAITISIDTNDTHSTAESFMGPIVFRTVRSAFIALSI